MHNPAPLLFMQKIKSPLLLPLLILWLGPIFSQVSCSFTKHGLPICSLFCILKHVVHHSSCRKNSVTDDQAPSSHGDARQEVGETHLCDLYYYENFKHSEEFKELHSEHPPRRFYNSHFTLFVFVLFCFVCSICFIPHLSIHQSIFMLLTDFSVSGQTSVYF